MATSIRLPSSPFNFYEYQSSLHKTISLIFLGSHQVKVERLLHDPGPYA